MQHVLRTIETTADMLGYDIEIEYGSEQTEQDWLVKISSPDYDNTLVVMGNDLGKMAGYIEDNNHKYVRDIQTTTSVAKVLHDWVSFDGYMYVTEFEVALEIAGKSSDLARLVFCSDRVLDFAEIKDRLKIMGCPTLWDSESFWLYA